MTELFHAAEAQRAARPAVLADLATNPGGSVDRALDLVNSAKAAGAEGVVVPVFDAKNLAEHLARRSGQGASTASLAQELRKLALDIGDLEEIQEEVQETEMSLVLAPLCLADVALAGRVPCDGLYVQAAQPLDLPLVQAAAMLTPPLLVGLARWDDPGAAEAAALVRDRSAGGALIYAPGPWPREVGDLNLNVLPAVVEKHGVPAGLMDYSLQLTAGAVAVAAGAMVVIRAMTLNPDAPGPDHLRSLDPVHFTHYADLAHQAATMLGPAVGR